MFKRYQSREYGKVVYDAGTKYRENLERNEILINRHYATQRLEDITELKRKASEELSNI